MTVTQIREAKEKEDFEKILNTLSSESSDLFYTNKEILRKKLYKSTFYSLLQVPQNVDKNLDWMKVLCQAYSKLEDKEVKESEEINEALYIFTSVERKSYYDVLLKTLRLFKESFFTVCYTIQVLKSRFKTTQDKKLINIKSTKVFVVLNFAKKRVYILEKKSSKFPTHITLKEHTFTFKDIINVKKATESNLSVEKVRLKTRKFDRSLLDSVIQIKYNFKGKKKFLYLSAGNKNRLDEFLHSFKTLAALY